MTLEAASLQYHYSQVGHFELALVTLSGQRQRQLALTSRDVFVT